MKKIVLFLWCLLFSLQLQAAPLQHVSHFDWLVKKEFVASPNANFFEAITPQEIAFSLSKLSSQKIELPQKKHLSRAEFYQALGNALATQVTVAHTNDVHSHILENKRAKEFGYAKIARVIKAWRKSSEHFLLLDAGDTTQGSLYGNLFKGESIIGLLHLLGYDAMAAGNHEFDYGSKQTLKLKRRLNLPLLSANVYSHNGKYFLTPYTFKTIAGIRFAILGLTTPETPISTHPNNVKGLQFASPEEVVRKLVPELKKKADRVIVLCHTGVEEDRKIAAAVDGIDLIVGGHSHTPLRKPEYVNGTSIVQAWEYGKAIGRADLYYYQDELVAFSAELFPYTENIAEDQEMKKAVDAIVKKLGPRLEEVLAVTEVPLDGERTKVRTQETNIGNFIADTLLERTKSIAGHEADVALINGGGIRTHIPAGKLTRHQLFDMLPFPNTLVVLEVSGKEMWKALEHGVSKVEHASGAFPQVAGMSFRYDARRASGKRILEVSVKGKALDLQKTYRLATNDFLASGGDGYVWDEKNFYNSGITMFTLVEEAFSKQKSLSPKVDGRIIDLSKP